MMMRKAGYCALTSRLVKTAEEWQNHRSTGDFKLRELVATRLTATAKPLPQRGLWDSVVTHTKLVDEFNSSKRSRRHGRLSTSIKFLKDHNILLHSQLFFNPATATWNVTNEFERVVLVGETFLQREVATRVQKLLPDATSEQLKLLLDDMTSEPVLAKLFDRFELSRNCDPNFRKKYPLSQTQKATAVLGIMGELQWFVVKTKATDRTHNNALFPPSDVLILHVLSVHCIETICGECIVEMMGSHIDSFADKWTNYGESIPAQMTTKPRTPGVFLLNVNAKPRDEVGASSTSSSASLSSSEGGEDVSAAAAKAEKATTTAAGVDLVLRNLSPTPVYGSLTAKQEGLGLTWAKMDPLDGPAKEEKVARGALGAMSLTPQAAV